MNLKEQLQLRLEENPFTPLAEAIYDILFNGITNFDFPPESRIVVNDIANSMGVSRTPVHNAIAMLEKDGLVYVKKNKGVYILPFNSEDYLNYFYLRSFLEVAAIRQTAVHITNDELQQLCRYRINLQKAYEIGDFHGIIEGEECFHSFIVKCCGNEYIIRTYDDLKMQRQRYRIYTAADKASYARNIRQHNYIYASILHRDPDCCAMAITNHLLNNPVKYETDYKRIKEQYEVLNQRKDVPCEKQTTTEEIQ